MAFILQQTRQFKGNLDQLLAKVPDLAMETVYHRLEDNPATHSKSLHSGHLRRLGKKGSGIWHSWIDNRYRLAWRYDDPGFITLLDVGDHDYIDDYASFDDDRVIGLVRAIQRSDDDTKPKPRTWQWSPPPAPAIFGHCPPRFLQLLGVPEEQVDEVKRVTEIEQVFELSLPDYAAQNLAQVYTSPDWSLDDSFDVRSVFYRANADELEAYCKGEIKDLLLKLSPDQDRLVEMKTTGPTLIKGVAGSGKTTVGIYRAMVQTYVRELFRTGDPRVLFVTYTETLAKVVEQMFEELYGQEKARRVEVWVLREWLKTYMSDRPGSRPVGNDGQLNDAIAKGIRRARRSFPDSTLCARGNDFFCSEIDDVIKGRDLRTWEAYAAARRTGRKTGLQQSYRRFVWIAYQEYQRQLEIKGVFDYLDLALHALQVIPQDPHFEPYDAVIVDEAQDLRPVQLQAVSLLAGGSKARSLILLADPAQSIYYKGVPWKDGDIHIAPARSFSLKKNFRNTRQILAAGWSLAQAGVSEDEETIMPDAADKRGPRPVVALCADSDHHDKFIVETITDLCNRMRFRPGDIAVLARRNDQVDHLRFVLKRAGIPVVHFREDAFDIFENTVKVVTINSAKGLEFPVVFLARLDEGELPRTIRADDEEELKAELRGERRLAYVGMTRAAQRLYLVSCRAKCSRFLQEIDPDTVRRQRYPSEEPVGIPF